MWQLLYGCCKPTQPLKEQTVSSEPLINQTETGKTRCSFSPKVNCEVFLCLNVKLWSRDMSPDQKFKMKEIGELGPGENQFPVLISLAG